MSTHTDTAIPTRKYAMHRLSTGDYLLPSNDLTVMWRLHTHEDGSFYGLVDCPYEARTFWRAIWMPMDQAKRLLEVGELPEAWADHGSTWREADWHLPSRKAAIECAMKHDARRMTIDTGDGDG